METGGEFFLEAVELVGRLWLDGKCHRIGLTVGLFGPG